LDKDAETGIMHVELFERRFAQIKTNLEQKPGLYGNCLHRLLELALFQAGTQADQAECETASSLMFRPPLVLIHQRGKSAPIIKNPNLPLTSQFNDKGKSSQEIINWLKKNTFVEVRTQPLIPRLYQLLEESGLIDCRELKNTQKKMDKLADTITFMASLNPCGSLVFKKWVECRPEIEKKVIYKKLCYFDLEKFYSLGQKARSYIRRPGNSSSDLVLPLGQEGRKAFPADSLNISS
jgi:hypothetical protein